MRVKSIRLHHRISDMNPHGLLQHPDRMAEVLESVSSKAQRFIRPTANTSVSPSS